MGDRVNGFPAMTGRRRSPPFARIAPQPVRANRAPIWCGAVRLPNREEILEDYPALEPGDIAAALEYAARQRPHRAARRVVRFLVDAQLPPALARWVTEAGRDGEHVGDCVECRVRPTQPSGTKRCAPKP